MMVFEVLGILAFFAALGMLHAKEGDGPVTPAITLLLAGLVFTATVAPKLAFIAAEATSRPAREVHVSLRGDNVTYVEKAAGRGGAPPDLFSLYALSLLEALIYGGSALGGYVLGYSLLAPTPLPSIVAVKKRKIVAAALERAEEIAQFDGSLWDLLFEPREVAVVAKRGRQASV